MKTPENLPGSHVSEPVRTPKDPLEYEWLTVDEAVAFCAERGLSRTPKTLRKWADRSFNKEDADILVRREDTMWSYRWKIEKSSLSRKVDQELELAGSNASEPVRTGAQETADQNQRTAANLSEPVRAGAGVSEVSINSDVDAHKDEPGAHPFEPVQIGSHDIRPATGATEVLDEVRKRLCDKDAEIAFLREQLDKAQAEVERRATSTDEALKTIDRVVRSFEMQAEANKALALSGVASTPSATPEEVRTTEVGESQPTDTQSVDHTPAYQQPESEWRRV